MRLLLIDADSVIPNIPLMKISSYYKTKRADVSFVKVNLPYYPTRKKIGFKCPGGYDKYFCSVVFEGNKKYILPYGNDIVFGGTGVNLITVLPDFIENCTPDYSLYPDNNTSYGFLTRGCIRKCEFCVVPKKEGKMRLVNTIDKIVQHKKVFFLDNNILGYKGHKEILEELRDKKIKHQFNQGLDIRLIDKENSKLLSELNYLGKYVFAFDDWSLLPIVKSKLSLLSWRKDWQLKFFVYCHPDMLISSVIKRIEFLKQHKCLPYLMRHIDCWKSINVKFYTDLAAYCNQVNLFIKMNFGDFLEKRHTNIKRIHNNKNLYYGKIVKKEKKGG